MHRVAALVVASAAVAAIAQDAPTEANRPESGAAATTAGSAEGERGPYRDELAAIREDLVQLRLEQVLADTDALLANAELPLVTRIEAWSLRSQAHVASGDLDAAANDFRELVLLDPDFAPEPSLMTPDATRRFENVRDRIVGAVRFDVRPSDATLVLRDRDRRVPLRPDALVRLVAGPRDLRFERPGYDPWNVSLEVVAGEETPLEVRLLPNAKPVVFRTDRAGVAVYVDGRELGVTAAVAGGGELVAPTVALGEHDVEYRLPCYRTARRTVRLRVALDEEPSPETLPLVRMQRAGTPLSVRGEIASGEVAVDGEVVGMLPLERAPVCPGERTIEVRSRGRRSFVTRVELEDAVPFDLEARPRPNVIVLGRDRWPDELAPWLEHVNVLAVRPGREVGADGETVWRTSSLDADVDLVLAPDAGRAGAWFAHSPALERSSAIEGSVPLARPSWGRGTIGAAVADSGMGGSARVVAVAPGGPADAAGIAVGDRVVEIGAASVSSAREVRRAIARAAPGAPLRVVVEGDARREFEVVTGRTFEVPRADSAIGALLRTAWARAVARAGGVSGHEGRAALALLLESGGRFGASADVWATVDAARVDGLEPDVAAYFAGRALAKAGREEEAVAALRRASGGSPASGGFAPPVRSAAADRLADLGVRTD